MAKAPAGLIVVRSAYGMAETIDRLRGAVVAHGMAVLAEIDHAAGAVKAGMSLRPMVVLAFGAAKAGTPLMQWAPTIGIDLPLKALVWTEEDGVVWLAVNDPAAIVERHGVLSCHGPTVAAMQRALEAVVAAATAG